MVRADPALVNALGRAFRWKKVLEDEPYTSISNIARAEKIERTYVRDIFRLALLAPDIVAAILDARQPVDMTLPVPFLPEDDKVNARDGRKVPCQAPSSARQSAPGEALEHFPIRLTCTPGG